MGRPFKAERGRVRVELDSSERELVAHLLEQVAELLDSGEPARPADPLAESLGLDPADFPDSVAMDPSRPEPEQPDDPAVARLLPQANREDPALASEFRRLTEHGLRGRKRAALNTARQALLREPPVVLATDEAQALVKGLTDVRLVLGERLGLHTDDDADLIQQVAQHGGEEDNPWVATALLYDVLTWWQESLVSALRPGPPQRNPPPTRA